MRVRPAILIGLILAATWCPLVPGGVRRGAGRRRDGAASRRHAPAGRRPEDQHRPTRGAGSRDCGQPRSHGPIGRHGRGPACRAGPTRSSSSTASRFRTRGIRGRARSSSRPRSISGHWRGAGNSRRTLDPTNQPARAEAIKDLDAAFVRLRAIQESLQPSDSDLLGQNLRFRMAQALADRAELDQVRSPGRRRLEDDALAILERPITEPALRGFAQLLRAELLRRQGRFDAAEEALATAAKIKPAPPPADLLGARVAILSGRKRFDEAISTIDAAARSTRPPRTHSPFGSCSPIAAVRHRPPSGRRPSRLCFAGSPGFGRLGRPRRADHCSSWRSGWSSPTQPRTRSLGGRSGGGDRPRRPRAGQPA